MFLNKNLQNNSFSWFYFN